MDKEKDNALIRKHNCRRRVINIGAIIYLLFLFDRLFVAIVSYKYGMDTIDYIKAAFFSLAICVLIGILFFGMKSGDEYIDILELQNESYRDRIKKLNAENDYLYQQNMKLRRDIAELRGDNVIDYRSKTDQ